VGEDVEARRLHLGDLFLIEQHDVRHCTVGQFRDVVGEVIAPPCVVSDLLVVWWAGAAQGADNSIGAVAYDLSGHVTRLAVPA
jgi:hypothetical protein